jgi:hypothetical protein
MEDTQVGQLPEMKLLQMLRKVKPVRVVNEPLKGPDSWFPARFKDLLGKARPQSCSGVQTRSKLYFSPKRVGQGAWPYLRAAMLVNPESEPERLFSPRSSDLCPKSSAQLEPIKRVV